MTSHRGVNVALLALDGVEKHFLVERLEARLRDSGLPVERVSWQRHLASADPSARSYPTGDLAAAWVDLFRIFFGGAAIDGQPLAPPESYDDVLASGIMTRLRTASVNGIRASSPLSSGWVELAAHTTLHRGVVVPALERGIVVLQESLGVKNVLKSLLMAEYLDPGEPEAFVEMRLFVHQYFGSTLAADVGVYLDADPAVLLSRTGGRDVSAFDSYRLLGGDPVESYIRLQRNCAREFGAFARASGWLVEDATDGDGDTVDRVVDMVAERIQTVRRGGSPGPSVDSATCP